MTKRFQALVQQVENDFEFMLALANSYHEEVAAHKAVKALFDNEEKELEAEYEMAIAALEDAQKNSTI